MDTNYDYQESNLYGKDGEDSHLTGDAEEEWSQLMHPYISQQHMMQGQQAVMTQQQVMAAQHIMQAQSISSHVSGQEAGMYNMAAVATSYDPLTYMAQHQYRDEPVNCLMNTDGSYYAVDAKSKTAISAGAATKTSSSSVDVHQSLARNTSFSSTARTHATNSVMSDSENNKANIKSSAINQGYGANCAPEISEHNKFTSKITPSVKESDAQLLHLLHDGEQSTHDVSNKSIQSLIPKQRDYPYTKVTAKENVYATISKNDGYGNPQLMSQISQARNELKNLRYVNVNSYLIELVSILRVNLMWKIILSLLRFPSYSQPMVLVIRSLSHSLVSV